MCLGSVFAWSMFNQPLMRLRGVVAQAPEDWGLGDVTLTFSLVMGGFAWGALFSKYLDRLGPRACSLAGAGSLGVGFGMVGLAAETHSLPVMYAGGIIWGVANGIAYMPPVAALMRWFPERKGFASGVVICGYGGGALVSAPLFECLLELFSRPPQRLGGIDDVMIVNRGGGLFTPVNGEMELDAFREVVVSTALDAHAMGVEPGVFLVGTGSTGASETFFVLGLGYAILMGLCATAYRLPPPVARPPSLSSLQQHRVDDELGLSEATKSLPFGLMFGGFALASTGAYALISSSKLMLASSFPGVPTNVLTSYVAGTAVTNLAGRLAYSNLSDVLAKRFDPPHPWHGRRETYSIMWLLAPAGFFTILGSVAANAGKPWGEETFPWAGFCLGTGMVLSSFGGSSATRPAVVNDIFGPTHVAAISARQLSAVLPAAIAGPKLMAVMSSRAERHACHDLAGRVDETAFHHAFSASHDQLDVLIEKKTVTIARLMELVPADVVDPTPHLFDEALLTAAGLTGVALILNRGVRPPAPRTK